MEQKAWASSPNAKMMQAQFLCLSHNLMLLMHAMLEESYDLQNEAEIKRKENRLEKMIKTAQETGRGVSSVYYFVQRFTKHSLKFIRCLRAYFFINAPLCQAVRYLRGLYATL